MKIINVASINEFDEKGYTANEKALLDLDFKDLNNTLIVKEPQQKKRKGKTQSKKQKERKIKGKGKGKVKNIKEFDEESYSDIEKASLDLDFKDLTDHITIESNNTLKTQKGGKFHNIQDIKNDLMYNLLLE